jgi:hypothetical protein
MRQIDEHALCRKTLIRPLYAYPEIGRDARSDNNYHQ